MKPLHTGLFKKVIGALFLGSLVLLMPSYSHASGTFTAVIVTPNSSGTNDQTDTTTLTRANVYQTNALSIVTVFTVPAASTTSTIGSCVITYSTTVADKLACTGNTAIINTITHGTAVAIGTALRSLTSVVDPQHGALSTGSAGANVSFFSTGVETASTSIAFIDGTSGSVSTTSVTNAIVPVAQINTIAIGGTVDTGDTFSVTVPTGVVTYTTQSSDTSVANIATGLNAALTATSTNLAFTNATSTGATIVLTAKTAGTPFTQTSSATNAASGTEQVTFAPPAGISSASYSVTLNNIGYIISDTTGSSTLIAAALASKMSTDPAVTCVATSLITCTAKVSGTAFTYATYVVLPTSSAVSSSGGGGGGGGGVYHPFVGTTQTPTPSIITTVVTPASTNVGVTGSRGMTAGASTITKTLHIGSRNKSVTMLQTLLGTDPTLGFTGGATGYYGVKTRTAVEAFQVKYGVVTPNTDGYGSVGPKTRAMLVTVFGR